MASANPLALDDRAPRTGLHVYKRQLRPKLLYKVKIPKAIATILKRYVAAVSPATKKRFQTTFLIREATKLAADIQHADPASIHGGNRFVLCRKLASLLPAEYCTQKSKNLLNDLVVAAIRFFKANGRQPKGTFKNSSTSDQPEPHPGEAEDAVRSQPLKSASSQADENGVAELEELPEVPGDMLNSRQASTDSQVLTTQTGRSPNQTSDAESIPASTITDTTRSDQTGRKAMTGNKISKKRKRSETHEAYADGEITDSPKLKKSKKESKKKVKKASTENGREHVQLQDSHRAAPKSTSTASPDTTIIAKNSNKIAQPVSAPAKKPFTTPLSTTAGAVPDRPEKRKMHRLERAVRELNGEDFSDESSSSNSSSDSEDETPTTAKSGSGTGLRTTGATSTADKGKAPKLESDGDSEVEFISAKVCTKTKASAPLVPKVNRPLPSFDPTMQEKEGKVYTVDVYEELWQEDVDEIEMLKAVLDEMGIDETKRRVIKVRIKTFKDTLRNALRAAHIEPPGKKLRKERRSK